MGFASVCCPPSVPYFRHEIAKGTCTPLFLHRRSVNSTSVAHRYWRLKNSSLTTKSFLQPSGNENHHTTNEEANSQDSHSVSKIHGMSAVLTADYLPLQDTEGPDDLVYTEAGMPAFQVLSPTQQELLSATPAHPEALNALYGTYTAACFMERVWRFIAPMVLAMLSKSLMPVAVVGFVDQFIIFVAGPWVGAVMDTMPRVKSFMTLSVIQTVAMLVSVGATMYALKTGFGTLATTSQSLLAQPWFLVLVVAGAIERLTGLAIGVAAERDWVVLLAGTTRQIALAEANAVLRRIDLICEIAGPTLFGVLLSSHGAPLCITVAAGIMAVTLPALIMLVHTTDKLSKGVLHRSKFQLVRDPSKPHQTSAVQAGLGNSSSGGVNAVLLGWKNYFAQPVLPASLAYVMLYFNAVLSPGGLMTSFLTQSEINPAMIGVFRSLCGVMGFLATFVSASVISKLGVLKAGAAALFFQASLLAVAVAVYLTKASGSKVSLMIFLSLIVVSRLGHWGYDLVDAQIFQTAIPESQANQVGTAEMSLASLAELIMLGVAILASDVSYFGGLATLSMISTASAAAIYWHWLSNPTADQIRLFPEDTRIKVPTFTPMST
ncbi:solute carrier family 40 (iron-regulated transporter), member 1 [Marchantia polymorpha subsp. ruderalis]|uniref:Solute carrier family 40 member n=2 Tax=Marchantia polymorpha TaxID=3197 RepID=A0AAF6ARF6_MARPO|nr:hypothetical protein MARPO_0001s0146 [Marchantia polymorpha]BBM99026.1 hypothetical protein Mp_1g18080 [Marchantia polymorpha subsp. ruderalis]|eukprot:PTQ50100.1 hypothetical protein MARPO_0001s0146 [Marchantia polymorpha]